MPPLDFDKGIRIHSGLVPDSILIFQRHAHEEPNVAGYGFYHSRYVLGVAVDCPMHLNIAGQGVYLNPDECVLIFPHQFHERHVESCSAKGSGGWLVITFDLKNAVGIECLKDAPRCLRKNETDILQELFQSYGRAHAGLEASYHLSRLLLSLTQAPMIPDSRNSLPTEDPERLALLQSVHQYLENPTDLSILSGMARALHLKDSVLRRRFQKYTGRSLAEYARMWRMEYARKMLRNQEANVTDIATRLGFSSIQSFSQAFKAMHGLSPKQYERLVRKNQIEPT